MPVKFLPLPIYIFLVCKGKKVLKIKIITWFNFDSVIIRVQLNKEILRKVENLYSRCLVCSSVSFQNASFPHFRCSTRTVSPSARSFRSEATTRQARIASATFCWSPPATPSRPSTRAQSSSPFSDSKLNTSLTSACTSEEIYKFVFLILLQWRNLQSWFTHLFNRHEIE